jgi:hypothetical protein
MNEKIFSNIADQLSRALKNEFIFLISSGSFFGSGEIKGWSDIDFVAVVKNVDLKNKLKINQVTHELEDFYKLKIGSVIIGRDELASPERILNLDGKAAQAVIELSAGLQKIFPANKILRKPIFKFKNEEIKNFSIKDIEKILSLYRRLIIRSDLNNQHLFREVVVKSVRYSIIATKLAVQAKFLKTINSDTDMAAFLQKNFSSRLSSVFRQIIAIKKTWPIKNDKLNKKILQMIDEYLEHLIKYVLQKNRG